MTHQHSASAGSRILEPEDLDALALGAWILGTGGGGDPYYALLNMKQLYKEGKRVTLLDPMYLEDDDLVAMVGASGAPLVMQERMADPAWSAKPVRMMEEMMGRKFHALLTVEVGGSNALHPLAIGAINGLPVVDADTMGRAYPTMNMTSFSVHGLPMFPMAIADIRDNEVVITRAESTRWQERVNRKIVSEFGSIAVNCRAPRTGREIKECAVTYSLSKAIRLGRRVIAARRRHEDPVDAILEETVGQALFAGKVIDIDRRTTEGFLRGKVTLEGMGEDRGSRFVLHFQNEFSVGERDGKTCVMTPDLICVVDSVNGDGVGTDALRYGQRVSVLALPPAPIFTTDRGIELAGPRAFGFDLDYRSVFETV